MVDRGARLLAVAVAFGLLMVVAVPQAASAATVQLTIVSGPTGFAFSPSTAKLRMGDTALWTNTTSAPHTVRNSGCSGNPTAGPAAFCSPVVAATGTFSTTINVAATYSYICTIHPSMQGTISVKPVARPRSGGVTETYTVIWASGSIPSGFDVDIQIQRPGQGFVDWTTDQTGAQVSGTFTPDAGAGAYAFRVRLQDTISGNTTAYSKTTMINVS